MLKKTWKEKLLQKLPTLILIYCLLQPLLDVAGYWQMQLEISNVVTTNIRVVLLVGSVLLGFLLSDRKRYYFIMAAVLSLLMGLHVIANLPNYVEWPTDLANIVRIYLMPLTVLCFITFLRQAGEPAFKAMRNGILINLAIIALVELLSVLTGTDRTTYHHEKIGILGWFYWSNSQSAILSIAAPIAVCWALNKWPKRNVPTLIATAFTSVLLFLFGTRLTYFTMVISNVGVAVCLLIISRARWKQAMMILLVTGVFIAGFFISPVKQRLDAVDSIENRRQNAIDAMSIETLAPTEQTKEMQTEPAKTAPTVSPSTTTEAYTETITETGTKTPVVTEQPTESAPASSTASEEPHAEPAEETRPENGDAPAMTPENKAKLNRLYDAFVHPLVVAYGYDRVEAAYDYTLDASVLGNWRTYKLVFCELLMEDAGPMKHLFGINLMDMRVFVKEGVFNSETRLWEDDYITMDVENDFHGIYFLLGIVGLVLMLGFLLYFGVRALIRIIRHFKTYFTLEMVGFAGAYCFGMLHAYFTVSVLRRNNASVYMALVLAGMWYLSRKELHEKQAEAHADPEQ